MGRPSRRAIGFACFRHSFLVGWLLMNLFPVYWMVATSFKPMGEWVAWPPHWVPHEPTLTNYQKVLARGTASVELTLKTISSAGAIWDSLVVTTISSALALLLGTFMAYSICRFRTGGASFPYSVLTVRMLPPIVVAVPFLVYYATLKLTDTYIGLILLYVPTSLPYVIWMMMSFIESVPVEVEQAARIMGASRFTVLRKITVPLVASGIVVTFLFVFILNWSEFLLALTMTHTELATLPVQLNKYQGEQGRDYGPQAAVGTIAALPVVALGCLIQKHLVKGFSFGMIRR